MKALVSFLKKVLKLLPAPDGRFLALPWFYRGSRYDAALIYPDFPRLRRRPYRPR